MTVCLSLSVFDLSDFFDNALDFVAQSLSLLHGVRLGVDANDGLGIGLAQMYPAVGIVYLNAVYGRDFSLA